MENACELSNHINFGAPPIAACVMVAKTSHIVARAWNPTTSHVCLNGMALHPHVIKA
jgi:hypothetical protein